MAFFMIKILKNDVALFFVDTQEKEHPSKNKQHTSQGCHRAQYTETGETKRKQAAAEKEDAEKEKQPSII